ncbi:MAG: T9SS type A sorting domain-containing protein [Candidatus Cloacimonadales bacterium]|nr:T9SS type A sorting domain-containing protein [Candidatus Cloacimonadales bacterium]
MLQYLIAEFPDSEYKKSSASYLLSIQEEDYQSLKTYYQNEPNLHSDDEIDRLTSYLQTYCDIQSENYQEAIDWLESIISNPPSLIDSVYAVIDLADLYLQMNGNSRGAVGRFTELIPASKEEFEQTREDLLSLLAEEYDYESEPENKPISDLIPACATLNGNYPNPFNPVTTISFSIPNESKIELSVFNLKGQKVRALVKDSFESGNHSIVWNGKDDTDKSVSSGIYFYKLKVNGISKQIRKCILMK